MNLVRNKFPHSSNEITNAGGIAPWVFYGWISAIFLMGGGSRPDIVSLILLRPSAFIIIGYSLIVIKRSQVADIKYPLWVLFLLAVAMLIQLIPFPSDIWRHLPGNQTTAQLMELNNIEIGWRPITRSPSATLNSLVSLSVPLSALLLFAIQKAEIRRNTLFLIIIVGLVSCLFAMYQMASPQNALLYPYRITNFGEPVGLFANSNHQAVFLNIVMLFLLWYFHKVVAQNSGNATRAFLTIVATLFVATSILLNGSRAGFGLLLLSALAWALACVELFLKSESKKTKRALGEGLSGRSKLVALGVAMIVFSIFAAVLFVPEQLPNALEQILREDPMSDRRFGLLPTLIDMSWFYQPFGAGFGSFEHIYEAHEITENLQPTYLNEAHNDWLQFVIEGGLFAVAILAAAALAFIRRLVALLRHKTISFGNSSIICAMALLMIALSSLVDYPLRTPSLMTLSILASAIFFNRPRSDA